MDSSTTKIINEIIDVFLLKGHLVYYDALKSGNINDTYSIVTDYCGSPRQYLVQKLNHRVFRNPREVAENILAVTNHIEDKLFHNRVRDIRRRVIKLYVRPDGEYYFVSDDGDYWRVMSYVINSETHNSASTPLLLRSVGDAFGEFQMYLSDFDAESLNVTIPDFHNTEKRYEDMRRAAEEDKLGRLADVKPEYDYLMSMRSYASFFREKHEKGEIPLRVTHNDTKCNNVMFDAYSSEHLAVIDLDTVMPGFVAHDFGDAVRFAANPGGEDAEDLSSVRLDMNLFKAFASGFVPRINGMVTECELDTLPEGVLCITLELAARFLTDYLQGDVYFKCKKPNHNLLRTRAQTALARDISKKLPLMHEELNELLKKS
ncbi:MAG: aminoglycoside phosphotransferase family protein [Clostridia bacterium]|nr:aminoglycoside phosphotransferase family protein [Clostridia bacterium]